MKLLAVETSSMAGSAAVLEWEGAVECACPCSIIEKHQLSFPEGTKHGKALIPSIETLLEKIGWNPGDLDAVAVSIGPGSYTGLRVGLICAKMIAVFAKADLVAVPSLDAIARNAGDKYKHVCVVVDARRDEVYTALYELRDSCLVRCSDCSIKSAGELAGSLRPGTCLLGDGVPIVESAIESESVFLAPKKQWTPRAEIVAEIGAGMYSEGVRNDPYKTEPMYLRKPAAEEKWREAACR